EVTKYFRRHDQDRRGGVVAPVAGADADELRPEDLAELGVFRVRQGLERRSIYDSPVLVHGAAGRLHRDEGLAAARGVAYDHGTPFQCLYRLHLPIIRHEG